MSKLAHLESHCQTWTCPLQKHHCTCGGHDIDDKTDHNYIRENYRQLLDLLAEQNCKDFVSFLLPRAGTNLKPYKSCNTEVISNHDSFIMALGELPPGFYHADRVNLKFPGTRTLVYNIHVSLP